MKKICIVNAHWSNRGDEAALRPIIDELLESYRDCKINVAFKDAEKVQQFPYTGNVRCFFAKFLPNNLLEVIIAVITKGKICKNVFMRKEIRLLCNQDVIIYSPGGAVINDRFWWRKQLEYLLPFFCAKYYKIPMVVAAPSIGPFEKYIWRNFIRKKLLQVPVYLCVREEFSLQYLKDIDIRKNVLTTIDTAFYDMPDVKKNSIIFENNKELNMFFQSYTRIIGMTITDFSWHIEYSKNDKLKETIENVIRDFISKRKNEGIGVLLIPQLFGNQNDSNILKRFTDENTFILSETEDTYFQQFLISKLYVVVGMRYHSNIFAAKMGVPFIAIAYEEKMQGFMEMCGLENYALLVEELSLKTLEDKWTFLLSQYEDYKQCLENYHDSWQRKAKKTIKAIKNVLDD